MRILFTDVLVASQIGSSEETLASLGRLYQHIMSSGDRSFALFSPWQSNILVSSNKKNLEKFKSLLRSKALDFLPLDGKWENDLGEVLSEPSFFIPRISKSFALEIMDNFNQDAIIYSGPETNGNVFLLHSDGTSEDIGKFHPLKIGEIYSEIKGKPFTFAGVALGSLDEILSSKRIDQYQIARTQEKLNKVRALFES